MLALFSSVNCPATHLSSYSLWWSQHLTRHCLWQDSWWAGDWQIAKELEGHSLGLTKVTYLTYCHHTSCEQTTLSTVNLSYQCKQTTLSTVNLSQQCKQTMTIYTATTPHQCTQTITVQCHFTSSGLRDHNYELTKHLINGRKLQLCIETLPHQ